MIERLRLTIPLRPGQDLMSYVAHLTLRNGLTSRSWDFCRDLGLDHAALSKGAPEQVARLASLSGVPESALQAEAIRTGKALSTLRGQHIGVPMSVLTRQAVCPGCLRDDLVGSDLPFNRSAYLRTVWRLSAIRTCPRHGMTVGTHFGQENLAWREPSAFLAAAAARLDAVLEGVPRRQASPLELYLLGRLDGVTHAMPFLDRLEFHVVARFCEALGLVQEEILDAHPESSESRLHTAGALGFSVAAAGEDAVTALLLELQSRPHQSTALNAGPGSAFRELYALLEVTRKTPAYAALRDFLRRHVEATMPYVPGKTFLGEPLRDGAVHSVRTASLTSGMHPKRLKKILVGLGHVEDDGGSSTDHGTIFDAAKAAPLISSLTEAMSISAAAAYLEIKRFAFNTLYQSGCLRPILQAQEVPGVGRHVYTRTQLDDFIDALAANAVPVPQPGADEYTISHAARCCNCSIAEVVELILGGKPLWVGRRAGERNFNSILVRTADVGPLVRKGDAPGLTIRKFAMAIRSTDHLVRLIIENGAVRTVQGINPVRRNRQTYIPNDEAEAFRRNYISVLEIAKTVNSYPIHVRSFLVNRGVFARIETGENNSCYYYRSDVERHINDMQSIIFKIKRK